MIVERWASIELAKIPELDGLVGLLRADAERHAPALRFPLVPFHLLDEFPEPTAWIRFGRALYGHR